MTPPAHQVSMCRATLRVHCSAAKMDHLTLHPYVTSCRTASPPSHGVPDRYATRNQETDMPMKALTLAAFTSLLTVPALAQTPTPSTTSVSDPGAPLSGYPRKALGLPTAAELKTATYVRDVIYGHRDGMALTYDVFKPKSKANGALVVNMVSAGWNSKWGPPEERQARYQWLIDKGFTVVALYHSSAPRFQIPDAVTDIRLGLRHIKLHAKDYGADPARIGVWGASAGGHLSLVAGTMADDG
ncbi:MAG: alpha/beta hydrolase, partial [Burkholderiales bacterium]